MKKSKKTTTSKITAKSKLSQDSPKSVEDLSKEELSSEDPASSLELSETDEDEDEGVGDGNIGRSTPDLLDK